MARAKTDVEQAYPVVGVLEHLDDTLAVLEARLPDFFHGARNLYYGKLKGFYLHCKIRNDWILAEPHKNTQRKGGNISSEAKHVLLQHLEEEQVKTQTLSCHKSFSENLSLPYSSVFVKDLYLWLVARLRTQKRILMDNKGFLQLK